MWRMSRKPCVVIIPTSAPAVREDDVRRDGRAVQEVVDLRERDAGLRAERRGRPRRRRAPGRPGVEGTLSTVIRPASSSTRIRSVNVPPTSTPMRFMRLTSRSAGTISCPTLHLLEPPVQVRGRDLVDPERGQLADPLEAPLRRPGDREVVDELAGQVARVLGRRVEVAGVVVVPVARGDEPRHLLRHAVLGFQLHHVRDVVRARGRRPAALLPRLVLVVGHAHARRARRSRPRPGRAPPPRRRRARARSPSARTRGGRRRRSSRCRRGAPARRRFLGPVAQIMIGTLLVRPADARAARPPRPPSRRAGAARLGQLGRRHRLEPERAHRVVAAPEAEDHAPRVEVGERRVRARA